MIKVYTLSEVAALLGNIKLPQLEAAVNEHSTYRMVGKTMLMTEDDIMALLRHCAPRRSKAAPPPPDALGTLVTISEPLTGDNMLFLGWCPVGQELDLLETVQLGYAGRLVVHPVCNTTYQAVVDLQAAHAKSRVHGSWFNRSETLTEALQALDENGKD